MNLVFASGFFVPQAVLGKDYFRDLPQRYPDALFAKVSVLGSIEERAGELAAAIAAKFPTGDIHIIAHSMGGLDSRYLLAKNLNSLASRVASLSTVATPHWGSPVARPPDRPGCSPVAERSGGKGDGAVVRGRPFTEGQCRGAVRLDYLIGKAV